MEELTASLICRGDHVVDDHALIDIFARVKARAGTTTRFSSVSPARSRSTAPAVISQRQGWRETSKHVLQTS